MPFTENLWYCRKFMLFAGNSCHSRHVISCSWEYFAFPGDFVIIPELSCFLRKILCYSRSCAELFPGLLCYFRRLRIIVRRLALGIKKILWILGLSWVLCCDSAGARTCVYSSTHWKVAALFVLEVAGHGAQNSYWCPQRKKQATSSNRYSIHKT